ncbi:hypothetical protein vseg_015547 [Gypsophila vaccaria]
MKTQYLCLPLMRPTTASATTATTPSSTNRRVVPTAATLMDKFREAVFRIIMATALSKNNNSSNNNNNRSNNNNNKNSNQTTSSRSSRAEYNDYHNKSVRSSTYYVHDPYPSDAVADCIEFIKKSTAYSRPSDRLTIHDDEHVDERSSNRGSTVSSNDLVIPLPVM